MLLVFHWFYYRIRTYSVNTSNGLLCVREKGCCICGYIAEISLSVLDAIVEVVVFFHLWPQDFFFSDTILTDELSTPRAIGFGWLKSTLAWN